MYKLPESVLVVIHTPALRVLMLERVDPPGLWQSVTGSLDDAAETPRAACAREVEEETGLRAAPDRFEDWGLVNRYPIFPRWLHRYAPGVTHNAEHVFSLCVASEFEPRLAPREHLRSQWLDWHEAAQQCFSWTNAEAVRRLPERAARAPAG